MILDYHSIFFRHIVPFGYSSIVFGRFQLLKPSLSKGAGLFVYRLNEWHDKHNWRPHD